MVKLLNPVIYLSASLQKQRFNLDGSDVAEQKIAQLSLENAALFRTLAGRLGYDQGERVDVTWHSQ